MNLTNCVCIIDKAYRVHFGGGLAKGFYKLLNKKAV